jgi:thiol-disulfide isomerase/thioredoxin
MYAKFKDLGPSIDGGSSSKTQQVSNHSYATMPKDVADKNSGVKSQSYTTGPPILANVEYDSEKIPYQNQSAPLLSAGFPAPQQFYNSTPQSFYNNSPPVQQFQAPPAQQFQAPPAQQFQAPPVQQFQLPPAQQFQLPPVQQFQAPSEPVSSVESVSTLNRKNEIINSNKLVVIDVYGTWCHPCKAIDEPYRKLAEKYNSPGTCMLIKEDVDLGLQQPDGVKIKGVPAFLFFLNGKYDGLISGADIVGVEHMIKTLPSKTI